jgi:hypothetical protein
MAETAVKQQAQKAETKREVSLLPSRMKNAEFARNTWSVQLEQGYTLQDCCQPKFWAHVAISLKPLDRIDVFAEDRTFYAELLVLNSDRAWATVHVLSFHDLTKATTNLAKDVRGDYQVTFKGPKGWCVIRSADNAMIQEKLHSEDDGWQWLEIHLQKRSA